MTDESFEVKAARALVVELREREQVLAPAVDELGRVRAARKDAERGLTRALERAGAPSEPRTPRAGQSIAGSAPAQILEVLRVAAEPLTLGVIVTRSRVPANHTSRSLTRLVERGEARRVSEGVYEATGQ